MIEVKEGRVADLLPLKARNKMGELYLDDIERTVARETARRGSLSVNDRPARRFVADPDARHRCADCRQPVRRARIIEGKPYCADHADADDRGSAGELMNTLQDWFGGRRSPVEAVR
jgi:hypothetical protein